MNENYKGSIELISGLKQKNNLDFPLMEASAVAFYDPVLNTDGKPVTDEYGNPQFQEIRLPEKIKSIGISDVEKQGLITSAVNEAHNNEVIKSKLTDVDKNSADVMKLNQTVKEMDGRLTTAEKGDNDQLKVTYDEDVSILYLHTGDTVLEDLSNVFSQTIIKGGGGADTLSKKLILRQDDEKTSFSVLKGKSAFINFTPLLTNIVDDTPANNENITISVSVNDVLKTTYQQKSNTSKPLDVSEFLSNDMNIVKIKASYSEFIAESGKTITTNYSQTWSINVLNMFLTSNFSDATVKEVAAIGDSITYTFIPYGNLEKTIYFKLNGEVVEKMVTSDSDRSKSVNLKAPGHGAYPLEVWCEGYIEDDFVESEHLFYNVMFAVSGNNMPIVRMITESAQGQQYTTSIIRYTVYKADSLNNLITLAVNDVPISEETVDRTEHEWLYTPDDFGSKKLSILLNGVEYNSLTLDVIEFPYNVEDVKANLELDFVPKGRTNQQPDYNVFKNNAKDENGNEKPITWTLSENFDWINGGWQVDENKQTYFCVKAGTSVDIHYNMFADPNIVLGADGALGNGKEFKAIFKTTNVAKSDATFMKCLALPRTGVNEVGFELKVHNGYVKANNATLEIPYAEEDIIEFDFSINPAKTTNGVIDTSGEIIPMIQSYEDGAPFLPLTYTSTETSFTQTNPVPITIGSPDCDVHIYRMRCYDSFLTPAEVLLNYIADAPNGAEMSNRFLRNQIYSSGVLTPESVAAACPDLKVIQIECPYFTAAKNEFVENTKVTMTHKNGDPQLDNWTFSNGFHTAQGTSSSKYGDAAFNINLLMCFDGKYKNKKILEKYEGREDEYWAIRSEFKSADGNIHIKDGTGKVGLTRTSVPTNYFNIKVNVASSENANNALLAKRFDRYLPYTSVGKKRDPFVKNTMEFINCVVFLRETDDDLSKHREFQDKEWHFYALGNIGDSKDTDQTRAYDPDDEKEFVVEILDNNMPNSAFQTGFMNEDNPLEIKYPIAQEDWKEGNSAYDALYSDDWGGDFTFEMRYEHPDVSDEQSAANIAKWNEFYEWVILSSDEIFKAQLKNWVNLPAAYYYYLFTERYTMMDNRAKNSFWHWAKLYITQAEVDEATQAFKNAQDVLVELEKAETPDEEAIAAAQVVVNEKQAKYNWALRYTINDDEAAINDGYRFDWWDYDNDTSLGIDNSGYLRMPYGKEDIDTEIQENGTINYYFNAGNSVFYRRLRYLFEDELSSAYNQSEISQCFSAENLIKEFDAWQAEFPEALWIEDYNRKYARTYRNGTPDHLNKRYNGRKKYHRRQWERDQEGYMASKYRASSAISGVEDGKPVQYQILMRCKTPSGVVVPPKYEMEIIPYSDMYLNVQFGPSYIKTQRAKAGQTYIIKSPFEDMTDNQVAVFSGKRIQSIGDISTFYPSEGTFSTGEKLKTLIIGNGTPGYANTYLTTLTTSAKNKMLEYLDIQNLTSLKSVYLQIPNLKHFFAQGSGISEAVFANNGLLEEAHLPASINSVVANNLYYLNDLTFENYDSLNKVVFNNCPNIDTLDIVSKANNLNIIRLIDVDWTLENANLLMRLLECNGVQADGLTLTDKAVLTGTVRVDKIRQSEIDAIREVWPEDQLNLIYNEEDVIPQVVINFYKEYEGANREELVYSILKDEGSQLIDSDVPTQELINSGILTKDSTPQYTFDFSHWRTNDKSYETGFGTNGIYVQTGMDFFGVFKETTRTYKVAWLTDKNGSIITNELGEKAEVEVQYGETAIYDKDKFGIPKKGANINTYYLFAEWSGATGFVQEDLEIYPIWTNATPIPPKDLESKDFSPAQIFALSQKSVNEGLGAYIEDGGQITLQLGYMPDYNGIVLIDEDKVFDGTESTAIKTDYKLFDEDKSFVLAMDFTMNEKASGTNTLMSCGGAARNRGVRLSSTTTNGKTYPTIVYNTAATKQVSNDEIKHKYREICVIRHIKGEPGLYVYTNDKYSMEPAKGEFIEHTNLNTITNNLWFGAQATETDVLSNFGVGTVHYAKLWFDDLGDKECKKICSWTTEKMTFRRCATNLYQLPYYEEDGSLSESGVPSKMSFVADQVLQKPIKFDADNGLMTVKYIPAWKESDVRAWLNTKLFAGLSFEWEQLIQPVVVKSLYGATSAGTLNTAEKNLQIVTTDDYFYIPSVAEIDTTYTSDAVYKKEKSDENAMYSVMSTQASRIRTTPNGDRGRWWTRSPLKQTADPYQIVVAGDGKIVEQWYNETLEDGTSIQVMPYRNYEYHILPAFSIGG